MLSILVCFLFITIDYGYCDNIEVDNNGYIVYCPCMGKWKCQISVNT